MDLQRFKAVQSVQERQAQMIEEHSRRSSFFASHVFSDFNMQQYLTLDALKAVRAAIFEGTKINRKIADQVAEGMKTWAIERGATHYSHWFQPLTGSTAEKHEAFFDLQANGQAIEIFGGNQLVQQESDASSFPSGGIRNTFEARGFTAWDPSSPAFIYGNTLCIPTIFVAYTGEALDHKAPLLKALHAVDQAATEVSQYFDKSVSKVNATLGWEQEYFLIDKQLATSRIDVTLTGRTLVGQPPAKGQQLDDHYFGVIHSRVLSFMSELEQECIKLGIPVKTRHNEVAPSQFEIAPKHQEANLSVDHNLLLMDLMEKISDKHHFKVLFHDKPFNGLSGSGKHNNWSLLTDTGTNLLSPGTTPTKNLQFLTFFINTIKAVDSYEEVIRASLSSYSNDLRLGKQGAASKILSVFVGTQLGAVLDELEGVSSGKLSPEEKTELKLNVVGKIPEILMDNTDRNRTSPFAFTGNKFEIRGVGAKANCAQAMTVLNTAVAHQLKAFKKEVDELIDHKGLKKDEAIFNVLREYIKTSKRIRFDGDSYSDQWLKEAQKRKLKSFNNSIEAIGVYSEKKVVDLFEQVNVFTETELKARQEVALKTYVLHAQIESKVLIEMINTQVIPASVAYLGELSSSVLKIKEVLSSTSSNFSIDLITKINTHVSALKEKTEELSASLEASEAIAAIDQKASYSCDTIVPLMEAVRVHADALELVVADVLWPVTKYRELLYIK